MPAKIVPCIMVKNESESILFTLYSLKKFDTICILDTGSTDDTIPRIKNFCEKQCIELRIKESTFIDFSVSRNELIAFAESFDDVDYILLLDSNEELKGEGTIFMDGKSAGIINLKFEDHQFWNLKIIKARDGWRYIGRVHEHLINKSDEKQTSIQKIETHHIFQERKRGFDKTLDRMFQDIEMLKQDYEDEPTNTRTVYYLAQTYYTLSTVKGNESYMRDAYEWYEKRTTFKDTNYKEISNAYMAMGELSEALELPWATAMDNYMKSFKFGCGAEPLLKIGSYYYQKGENLSAFIFVNFSARIDMPEDGVNPAAYDYHRWMLLSAIFLKLGESDPTLFYAGLDSIQKAHEGAVKHKINLDKVNEFERIFNLKKEEVDSKTIKIKLREEPI